MTNPLKFTRICTVLVLMSQAIPAASQDALLTVSQALQKALADNYDIQLVELDQEQAENNAGILNSGYLPTAQGNGGIDYIRNTNDFLLNSGEGNTIENAETYQYSGGVSLNYVLFDGLGRLYNYRSLKEQVQLTDLQARQLIENTLSQVYAAYYNVAETQEQIAINVDIMSLSKKRLTRAEKQREYGQATRLEVLNAEVDFENDSIQWLNARQQFSEAVYNLNLLLGQSVDKKVFVETTVAHQKDLNLTNILQSALSQNTELKALNSNIRLTDISIKQNKAGGLPKLSLSAGYNYNQTEYGFNPNLQSLTTTGLNGGLTLSWNLFDGGSRYTRLRNSKLERKSLSIEKRRTQERVKKEILTAWSQYENNRAVYKAQMKSVETNERNFQRAQKQFKLGQITSLDYRQAQVNLMNAKLELNAAKYQWKLSEIELLRLSGMLVNQ